MTQDQLQQSQQATIHQGNLGEQFALAFERKRLPDFLHGQIVHFKEHEIALGYDILSFETRTSILPDRYIEVKTFRGHPHFYWTDNEIAAARKYADHYYLYLIDIDRINEPGYEPQIIPNPAVLFDEPLISEEKKRFNAPSSNSSQNGRPWPSHPTTEANGHTWTFHPVQYAFSLNAETNIPHDWDTSTILIGCYNHEQHLRWILDHNLYNVRAQKDIPGAVTLNNPQVRQAKYLILYSVANPRVYMLYALEPKPYRVTKTEMQALGYPNPHAFAYILHPIRERLNTFHINLAPILREVNHQGDNTYGTPLYLTGIQLRRFMPQPPNPAPTYSEPYMAPPQPALTVHSEPYKAPPQPAPSAHSEPYFAPQASTKPLSQPSPSATVPKATDSSRYQAPHERPSMVAEPIRPYPAKRQGAPWPPPTTPSSSPTSSNTPPLPISPHSSCAPQKPSSAEWAFYAAETPSPSPSTSTITTTIPPSRSTVSPKRPINLSTKKHEHQQRINTHLLFTRAKNHARIRHPISPKGVTTVRASTTKSKDSRGHGPVPSSTRNE